MINIFSVALFIACLSMIFWIINIFIINYIVIPNIEKKIGKKLEFSWNIYNIVIFGSFLYRHVEIMKYIVLKYLAWKFKKNPNSVRLNSIFALQKINYNIENASCFDVVFCFFVAFNYLLAILSLATGVTIAAIYGK